MSNDVLKVRAAYFKNFSEAAEDARGAVQSFINQAAKKGDLIVTPPQREWEWRPLPEGTAALGFTAVEYTVPLQARTRQATPCPICAAPHGFHEETCSHGRLPAHLNIVRPDEAPRCNCGFPFDSAGSGVCRHPAHARWLEAQR